MADDDIDDKNDIVDDDDDTIDDDDDDDDDDDRPENPPANRDMQYVNVWVKEPREKQTQRMIEQPRKRGGVVEAHIS